MKEIEHAELETSAIQSVEKAMVGVERARRPIARVGDFMRKLSAEAPTRLSMAEGDFKRAVSEAESLIAVKDLNLIRYFSNPLDAASIIFSISGTFKGQKIGLYSWQSLSQRDGWEETKGHVDGKEMPEKKAKALLDKVLNPLVNRNFADFGVHDKGVPLGQTTQRMFKHLSASKVLA